LDLNIYEYLLTQELQFYGGYTPVDEENEDVFAFLRTQGNFGYLIVLNWKADNTDWTVPEDIHLGQSILMIGNYAGRDRHLTRQLKLEPYEARIYTIRL
jgi:oligo-1,6-glucosidase